MKSKFISHKDKQIFHIDLSNFGPDLEAFKEELEAVSSVTMQQPEASLLVLTDMRNTLVTMAALQYAQGMSAKTTKHVRKTAVIGVAGVRKTLLDTVSMFSGQKFSVFDDIEDAKDWLVED